MGPCPCRALRARRTLGHEFLQDISKQKACNSESASLRRVISWYHHSNSGFLSLDHLTSDISTPCLMHDTRCWHMLRIIEMRYNFTEFSFLNVTSIGVRTNRTNQSETPELYIPVALASTQAALTKTWTLSAAHSRANFSHIVYTMQNPPRLQH